MAEKNEFDDIEPVEGNVGDFAVPAAQDDEGSMINDTNHGEVYDFMKAPEFTKAPPRIDMNGKTVKLVKAELILPPKTAPFMKTRNGLRDVKMCIFRLYFDNGQQEVLSGVRVFRAEPNSEKYSHPSMTRDENNQASKLLGAYARFMKKSIAEVALRDFYIFLNSKPTVKIKSEEVVNPKTKEAFRKNLVDMFV